MEKRKRKMKELKKKKEKLRTYQVHLVLPSGRQVVYRDP